MTRASFAFAALALLLTNFAFAQPPAPATPAAPRPFQVPNPHYVTVPMSIDVNAPAAKVWARIGKFCDIGEWGVPGCTLLSGDGGLGSVRSTAGSEVMVGRSQYSYTYTQPVREGVPYNLYHGTLEAVPVTASTSRISYTLVFDNSMLADDAAREKDIATRKARFTKMIENMKVLAEGGTLPPGAVAAPAAAPAAAAPR
jgi:Polyketide cyclase / dehydrase and lipid transport